MIDPAEFDAALRRLVNKDPFFPFYVELDDGRRLLVRQPGLAFGGGGAVFIDPEDGALVDFSHEHVAGFRPAAHEVGA